MDKKRLLAGFIFFSLVHFQPHKTVAGHEKYELSEEQIQEMIKNSSWGKVRDDEPSSCTTLIANLAITILSFPLMLVVAGYNRYQNGK